MSRKIYDGQLTILDFLRSLEAVPTASTRLFNGQVVYIVDRCDISKYEVYGIYTIDDDEQVVLIAREGAETPFRCISLEDMEGTLFETEKAAKEQALKALDECDCILASDMKILGFKAFTATTDDGTLLTAFYAQLANGYVYIKDYYSCGHLIRASLEKAESILMAGIERYSVDSKPSEKIPSLKNMYRTNPTAAFDWEYAERKSMLVS